MTNKEKEIYAETLTECNLRFACSHLYSELNNFEIFLLGFHLRALKLRYLLFKGWFSWSLLTKNNWSNS